MLAGGAVTIGTGGQVELGGNLQFADASVVARSGNLAVAAGGEIHGNGSITGPITIDGTVTADAGPIAVAKLRVSAGNGASIAGSGTLVIGPNPALAAGGVLTLTAGGTAIRLRFIGDLSSNSFTLGAGAPGPGPGETSIVLSVTPVPAPPLPGLHLAEGGPPAIGITNDSTPLVSGTTPAHNVVALRDEAGTSHGSPTLTTANPGNTAGTYDVQLLPLAPGQHESTVTASGTVATVTGSVPLSLLVLPNPVNGITIAASVDSAAVAALRDQGAGMQFRSDTEALQFTDGTLSVGPDTGAADIQRLYEGLLGPVGDTDGLTTFQALLNQSGAATVASAMLGSPEFQALHGPATALNPIQFVTLLYEGLLGRPPDDAGLTVQPRGLQNGMSQGLIAANIAASSEGETYLAADTANVWVPDTNGSRVIELFRIGLDRAPDPGGLSAHTQALQNGVSIETLANSIVTSAEFMPDHAGQDTASLIAGFYAGGLGRAPNPDRGQPVGGSTRWRRQPGFGSGRHHHVARGAAPPDPNDIAGPFPPPARSIHVVGRRRPATRSERSLPARPARPARTRPRAPASRRAAKARHRTRPWGRSAPPSA